MTEIGCVGQGGNVLGVYGSFCLTWENAQVHGRWRERVMDNQLTQLHMEKWCVFVCGCAGRNVLLLVPRNCAVSWL